VSQRTDFLVYFTKSRRTGIVGRNCRLLEDAYPIQEMPKTAHRRSIMIRAWLAFDAIATEPDYAQAGG
jgi:hypothetical protein